MIVAVFVVVCVLVLLVAVFAAFCGGIALVVV